jgi:thiamine biosynthesis lipoprotein
VPAHTVAFAALGTTAEVTVTERAALADAAEILREELDAIDRACSRFRDDSELAELNRSAGRPLRVSPLLLEALAVAVRAAALTDGAVDPTIGRGISGLGWDLDYEVVVARAPRPRIDVVPAAGWRSIRLDEQASTARVPAGVELDLGATAKALAADRAAGAIASATGTGVLVNLGGDIAVAGPSPRDGWPIRVTDDHRGGPTARGQTVAIRSGGLATSSTTVRRWRAAGSERHHILDPRTGLPVAEIWQTVSVAAGTCVDANTASTAAVIRGLEAPTWLERLGLPSRLAAPTGAVATASGWPQDSP